MMQGSSHAPTRMEPVDSSYHVIKIPMVVKKSNADTPRRQCLNENHEKMILIPSEVVGKLLPLLCRANFFTIEKPLRMIVPPCACYYIQGLPNYHRITRISCVFFAKTVMFWWISTSSIRFTLAALISNAAALYTRVALSTYSSSSSCRLKKTFFPVFEIKYAFL